MRTVLHVVILYAVVLVGLRVLGKRELAEMSPLELVTLLLIPELASQALTGDDYSLTNALVGLMTLFAIVFILSVAMHLSKKAEEIISDVPSVLVQHGELVVDNLNKERVTPDELLAEVHKAGLERLNQVRWAVLESDGRIAIVPEPPDAGTPSENPHQSGLLA